MKVSDNSRMILRLPSNQKREVVDLILQGWPLAFALMSVGVEMTAEVSKR